MDANGMAGAQQTFLYPFFDLILILILTLYLEPSDGSDGLHPKTHNPVLMFDLDHPDLFS